MPAIPVVSYTPIGEEQGFTGIVPEDVPLILQRGDSFGERLQFTASDLLASGFEAVCLIDSDSPTVPMSAYRSAVDCLLSGMDCGVMGPSDDGGYYLIGVNTSHTRLFEEIHWSTESVADETRERAAEINLPLHELPTWFDIDAPEALNRLQEEISGPLEQPGYPAPHTRAALISIFGEGRISTSTETIRS